MNSWSQNFRPNFIWLLWLHLQNGVFVCVVFVPQAKQSLATLNKDVPKRHSLAMPSEPVVNGNQEWVMQADLPLTAAIRQSQQTLYHSHPADRQGNGLHNRMLRYTKCLLLAHSHACLLSPQLLWGSAPVTPASPPSSLTPRLPTATAHPPRATSTRPATGLTPSAM